MRLAALLLAASLLPLSSDAQKRALRVDDIYRVRDVGDPRRSPDGQWVAYTVRTADSTKDKNDTDVWMTSWDGTKHVRLTSTPEGESSPRWSPDGKYLSFASGRMEAKGGQIWLLDRLGGEAQKLTEFKDGVEEYAWSPDGTRIAVITEEDADTAKAKDDTTKKTAKPIVVDRYTFKRDVVGYLGGKRQRIYIFDLATKKASLVTTERAFDESEVVWSPDGKRIAFVSKRGTEDVDRDTNTDIWVADAKAGAVPKKITSWIGEDGSPVWSPDGRSIAYLQGPEAKYYAYGMERLAVVQVDGCPAAGCAPKIVTSELDRAVYAPRWSRDGKSIYFVVADDRAAWIGWISPNGGRIERVTTGRTVVDRIDHPGADGRMAIALSTAGAPSEVYALEGSTTRRLTKQNDEWLSQIQLATTEDVESRSSDGTVVRSLLAKPAGFRTGTRYPFLLRIHGGPNSQDDYSFDFERELFAANGYLVLNVNYRGSSGRGEAFQRAIWGDWGNKEVVDLIGAVDAVVATGIVDTTRMGIGGWSSGGILTDYTIATTTRFRAATSGAGSALQLAMYGVDQYTIQYESELGAPWKSLDPWIKVSYPFLHADRIKTPTLFLVGEKDFNVPAVGSEQMYQALRSLGIPTQLVIYPGQYHGITVPSYRVDRLRRYLDWYARYLSPGSRAN